MHECMSFHIVDVAGYVLNTGNLLPIMVLYCNCIAVNGSIPWHSYGVSLAIWDHTVLPATRHKWTHPALTPAIQAGTRFTYPGGMEGWVDLVDLIVPRPGVKPASFRSRVQRSTTAPPRQGSECRITMPIWLMCITIRHIWFCYQVSLLLLLLVSVSLSLSLWELYQLFAECMYVWRNTGT